MSAPSDPQPLSDHLHPWTADPFGPFCSTTSAELVVPIRSIAVTFVDALQRAGAIRTGREGSELQFNVAVPRDGLGDRLGTALRAAAAGQLRLAERVARQLGIWPRA